MNEPKVPDDSDWRTVEIFLFSNGQHLTPPRKYHLASEDLSRWSSTLMSLAHAQYGTIFSSIDLYTVEGQQVHTPMQISNGAAYVAVPPQDTFIPAGYSEYLIRASRSREKRQNKFKSNEQGQLQQDDLSGKIEEASSIEAKKVVKNMELFNEEVASTAIVDQPNSAMTVERQYSAMNHNTVKQIEKKTSNNKNSTILKKQDSLIPPTMVRKTSMKIKDNPLRKNLKVNTTKGTNNGSTISTNGPGLFKSNAKSVTKTGKILDKDTLNNFIERTKTGNKVDPQVSTIEKVISSHEKTITTDNVSMEGIIADNELIVVKKQDSGGRSIDKNSSTFTRQTDKSSIVPILMPINESIGSGINKEELPVTVINNLIENVYNPDAGIINDITSRNNNDLLVETKIQESLSDKTYKNIPVDNFVAVIDKGDVVNFNLKIEVRKCEGVINKQESKPIASITEKSSQVNLGQKIKETVSKQTSLTIKQTTDENNPKVVVIKCSCCENHNLNDILHKIDTPSLKLDDKKYVVLLPDPQNDKQIERDECIQEPTKATENHDLDVLRHSVENPVKKVYATTSIQRLTSTKTTQDVGVAVSSLESHEPTKTDTLELHRHASSIQKLYQAESMIALKNKLNAVKTADNATQTEWYTMLLEARRHEDGRYTFYLPPLHVLKYYGL